jgi:small subunit ribosomal protein S4e
MHTKRLAVGGVKGIKWTATPRGAHRKSEAKPLVSILRDLGYADNAREARKIIVSGKVKVDGIIRKDQNYGAGLMDVVSLPQVKKNYRIIAEKNGLVLKETSKATSLKPCRVTGKKLMPKGKMQITLHDGTTILFDKANVNDTLILEMPGRKVKEVIKYAPGHFAQVVRGRHRGHSGTIKDVTKGTAARPSLTQLGDLMTLTEYIFVLGKVEPVIEL